ncbi:hypothetical protein OIU91_32415 [Streptomyces sp. NBC_01456]|uniref:hypothetical protein n=1 Tax=unclassified Streptomyces TaxID=2593676 RepID=UPI002E310019|nr:MULTISPECIES: hypothetical protein [unclassified Streptomyces]
MSHTTLRHARKAAAAMVITVAAFGLTACQGGGSDASAPAGSAHATHSSTSGAKTARNSAGDAPTGTAEKPGTSCTNQINYAGDSRSNAEINSIGEKTGHCPAPEKGDKPSGTPKKPGTSCTNQINYAGDSRSNAEINSIGEKTGHCPPVRHQ